MWDKKRNPKKLITDNAKLLINDTSNKITRMDTLKLISAVCISKLAIVLIKVFKLGSGYTWPGNLALKIYPTILTNNRLRFNRGVIVISGTNGKTTTAKLCEHILTGSGFSVVHNNTGGNILNGIVSTYLNKVSFFGSFKYDFGVFEVDEFVLPEFLKFITPDVLVLLNLSRDQLDRYGEVDTIVERWADVLKTSEIKNLVLHKNEKHFKPLVDSYKGNVIYFDADSTYRMHTELLGDFNSKNVNAAVNTCLLFGLSEEVIVNSLSKFSAAYGRGEIVEYYQKLYQVFLAKNPASFNNNLDTLVYSVDTEKAELRYDALLFILNDEVRDGRDVSWIYDINPVKLLKACENKHVFVSGSRCYEMALRIQYAGIVIPIENVNPSLKRVIDTIYTTDAKELVVLPNYSGMLQFRKLTLGKEIL